MRTATLRAFRNGATDSPRPRFVASNALHRYSGKSWNWFALRGLTMLSAGLILLFIGLAPFIWVGLALAAFLVIDGTFSLGTGLDGAPSLDRTASGLTLRGVTGLVAGFALAALTLIDPGAVIGALLLFSIALLLGGALDFAVAFRPRRRRFSVEWPLAGASLLAVFAGTAIPLLALSMPEAVAIPVTLLLGVYLLAGGILLVGQGVGLGRPERSGA